MKLEKVYDELYGMIEDLKKKIGAGGSQVTITPTLESGEKLADYSIDGEEGAIYAPLDLDLYSTTERLVGKWIDNSDIFCKTIHVGAVDSSTKTAAVPHGISDLDKIIKFEGVAIDATNHVFIPLPFANQVDTLQGNCFSDATAINVWLAVTGYESFDNYVTIWYTKTPPTESKNRRKK